MMKNILIKLAVLFTIVFAASCEKKVNQWEVDPSHQRLFSPLVFEMVEGNNAATSVEISYTKILSADRYVFEFSKDSLQFNHIVKTVEILADTLTPFSSSTTPNRIAYRTIFNGLQGNTGYSVRMKGVDTLTGLESAYSQFYFKTGAEQIFTKWTAYTDKVQVFWTPTDSVSHITVTDTTGKLIQDVKLTAGQIQGASATIESLSPGTNYILTIYNDTQERGTEALKTTGLKGGYLIHVNPGDDIAGLISSAVAKGDDEISLLFTGGEAYDIGSFTVPAGVADLSFTGIPDVNGALPSINMPEIAFSDLAFGRLLFEDIDLKGDYGKYLVYLSDDNAAVNEFSFTGCNLSDFRSIVRVANNKITVGRISFDNCLINNTGGYGVVNVGGSNAEIDTISFKNSTLTEIATQLMDVRAPVGYIYIGHCTFCNLNSSLSQLLRFDTKDLPLAVITEANIIAGNNGGAKINALSFDMSSTGLNVSFGGSYITNDMVIDKYGFSNITLFNGTTYDLFVDPDNGNFAIKPESGFGGRGTAGDPRWFN
jgi:hypothetical protein